MSKHRTTAETDMFIEMLGAIGADYTVDYSGRCMYGERCVSVDFDTPAQLAILFVDLMAYADGSWNQTLIAQYKQLIIAAAYNLKTDSMGLGEVAYWPAFNTDHIAPEDVDAETGR